MDLSGSVMSRDRAVAMVEHGQVTWVNEALVPFRLRSGDIEGWLSSRAIDRHRTNSRLLKKALRLTDVDDAQLVLKVNACTITDSYWFRPEGSALTYADVRFTFNDFDKLALWGDPDSFNHPMSPTPELTNIGSFEKCWRLTDGEWWLYKQGTDAELFSELMVCRLGQTLGFDMAEYMLEGEFIKSRDFTHSAQVNFEPAEGLMGENDDYRANFNTFYDLSPQCARQYLTMIYMDTLVFNMDRHTKNYGILRDVESGAVLSMAPNFDNNIALISRGYPKDIDRRNDRLIALFAEFIHGDSRAKGMMEQLRHPPITEALLARCMEDISLEVDRSYVSAFIRNGAARLEAALRLRQEQSHTDEPTMDV